MMDPRDETRRLNRVIRVLSGVLILAFTVVALSLWQDHQQTVDRHREACQSRAITLDVLSSFLLDAEHDQLSRGHLSDGEAQIVHQFYARQFDRIQKARC